MERRAESKRWTWQREECFHFESLTRCYWRNVFIVQLSRKIISAALCCVLNNAGSYVGPTAHAVLIHALTSQHRAVPGVYLVFIAVSHACCCKKTGPDTQTKVYVNDSPRRAAHRNLSLHASCILSRLVSVNASQKLYRRLLVRCWKGVNASDASAPGSTCRCNISEQVHVSGPQVTGEAAPAILDEPKSFGWAL